MKLYTEILTCVLAEYKATGDFTVLEDMLTSRRNKKVIIRKRRNQKEIPTRKTEVGKTKEIYLQDWKSPSMPKIVR